MPKPIAEIMLDPGDHMIIHARYELDGETYISQLVVTCRDTGHIHINQKEES